MTAMDFPLISRASLPLSKKVRYYLDIPISMIYIIYSHGSQQMINDHCKQLS